MSLAKWIGAVLGRSFVGALFTLAAVGLAHLFRQDVSAEGLAAFFFTLWVLDLKSPAPREDGQG